MVCGGLALTYGRAGGGGQRGLSPNGWHKSATISLVEVDITPGGTKSIVRQRDYKWQVTPPGDEAAWARKTRLGTKAKSRKRTIEYVVNGTLRSKKQERRPAPAIIGEDDLRTQRGAVYAALSSQKGTDASRSAAPGSSSVEATSRSVGLGEVRKSKLAMGWSCLPGWGACFP